MESKTELSSIFGFTPIENEQKRPLILTMGYLVRFFVFVLFLPNAIKFYRSTMVDLDMDTALDCLIFLSAHFTVNTQIYSAISKTETLFQLSVLLTEEVEQRKRSGSGQFYSKMENLYRLLAKWFFIILIVSTLVIMSPALFITLRNVLMNDEMLPNMWILSMKVSLPFEVNNVPVYLLIFFASAFCMWSMAIIKTITIEILYRYGLHIMARCEDMAFQLQNVAKLHSEHKEDPKWVLAIRLQVHLSGIIDFHDRMLDFFDRYSAVTSGIIFFEFTTLIGVLIGAGSTMAKCSPLDGDITVMKSYFAVIAAACSIFISSKMGSEVSHKLAELPNGAYLAAWEDLSPMFQRYIYTALMVAQRPRDLSGFGLITCNLDTFSQTMKTIVSFILIFKEV